MMGLLDLIPVAIGAGLVLKMTDVALAKRDIQSLRDRAMKKKYKKKMKKVI